MQDIIKQRCFNHQNREAAARCPECGNHFCRECVTEHDDRVLCSGCLSEITGPDTTQKKRFAGVRLFLAFLASFFLLWVVFYYFGRVLLTLPDSFHEGTLWNGGWWK